MAQLTGESARHFLTDLRAARAAALADAEGFDEVLFAIERLGAFLLEKSASLAKYREPLRLLSMRSALASDGGSEPTTNTLRFERVFDLVNEARNDALHQGAAARHITRHCVDLALILEEAMLSSTRQVRDFMSSAPVEAKLFEPVASIRRTMLMNAYSYLPVKTSDGWKLVADVAIARFLRRAESMTARTTRLGMSLKIASTQHGLELIQPGMSCVASDDVSVLVSNLDERPVLVLREDLDGELVGLVTAFDLL